MKKHLNTLFVTTQGAYLAKDGETVAVRIDGETALRVPLHTLGAIACFGNVGCSPFLLGFYLFGDGYDTSSVVSIAVVGLGGGLGLGLARRWRQARMR